jgi:hypothetical protein
VTCTWCHGEFPFGRALPHELKELFSMR